MMGAVMKLRGILTFLNSRLHHVFALGSGAHSSGYGSILALASSKNAANWRRLGI